MIIPSSLHGVIASSRPKIVISGGGGDVTPNAIDWGVPFWDGGSESYVTNQTITGIDTTINLYWECSYCGDGGSIYYSKNNGAWTLISELSNISISNNDTLRWKYVSTPGTSQNIFVKNASDSNALLDTIDFYVNIP